MNVNAEMILKEGRMRREGILVVVILHPFLKD